jgi:hypothetical protein
MGVYAPESSQTAWSDSIIAGVWNHYFLMVSHNNVGDLTLTIDEEAYLKTNFMGQVTDIASEFEGNKELGWKATAIEIFKLADMAGFKPAGIPEKFFHLNFILKTLAHFSSFYPLETYSLGL